MAYGQNAPSCHPLTLVKLLTIDEKSSWISDPIYLVFVKDSILGNWPKYERRRREKNRARAPKARESAGGEKRAQRAFRRRRKRFREVIGWNVWRQQGETGRNS